MINIVPEFLETMVIESMTSHRFPVMFVANLECRISSELEALARMGAVRCVWEAWYSATASKGAMLSYSHARSRYVPRKCRWKKHPYHKPCSTLVFVPMSYKVMLPKDINFVELSPTDWTFLENSVRPKHMFPAIVTFT